jgi:hypothetical protein
MGDGRELIFFNFVSAIKHQDFSSCGEKCLAAAFNIAKTLHKKH